VGWVVMDAFINTKEASICKSKSSRIEPGGLIVLTVLVKPLV
jgi:hypothetical protein